MCSSTFRLMVIQIHAILLSFDSSSKTIKFSCNLQRSNLTVYDGLSNDNEIA
jgi:hypothetical protein